MSVKSNFLEYTKALMVSQLENSIDLHQDSKQAVNICYEQRESSSLFKTSKVVEMKDVATQTISSKLLEIRLSAF